MGPFHLNHHSSCSYNIVFLSSLPCHPHIAFWVAPCDWLIEKENHLVYRWFYKLCMHHSEWTNCIPVLFWDSHEGHWRRKIFTVGRASDSTHGCTFFLEGKRTGVQLWTDPWDLANGLVGWDLEGAWLENYQKGIWWKWAKDMKIPVSHVNTH